MAQTQRINKIAPVLALFSVVLSNIFPGRQKAEVERVRARCDAISADNDSLRRDLIATLAFLREYDAPESPPDGGSAVVGGEIPGARYMRARGRDGVGLGRDWWLCGDMSPWGVVESSYPGGFVAGGSRYSFVSQPIMSEEKTR